MKKDEAIVLARIAVLAQAIRDLGQVPSGHLYANVMGHMTLAEYEHCINALIKVNLVRREPTHLLVWIGPAPEGEG